MPYSETGCDFCRIVRGELPATVVAEGDNWLAFFPLQPATPGHTLVIPRDHVVDYWEASGGVVGELARAARWLGLAALAALRPDGMNLITSRGMAAEQTVRHLHLHVVPRWHGDRMDEIWPSRQSDDGADLEAKAAAIREAFKNAVANDPA